jgi:hypothetical protein
MAYELEDREGNSPAVWGGNGFIEAGMLGALKEGLDEEVGSGMQIWKTKHLMDLAETGKVCFDCVRVQMAV